MANENANASTAMNKHSHVMFHLGSKVQRVFSLNNLLKNILPYKRPSWSLRIAKLHEVPVFAVGV